jgi:hypothetical protein
MLQRLLIITLTLCSLAASAQWQQTGSKVRYVNGLGIPTKDTAAGGAADSSQILIRPADSSLYIKYKRTWVKVGSGGGGGGVGGSGTINRVPKFTAGTTLGNSSIVDSASAVAMTINPSGKVGINTLTPVATLDVNGSFRIPGIGSNVNPASAGTSPNYLRFLSSGADFYVGTEGSTAGGFFTGSLAYDNVIYGNSTAINLINGGVSRLYVNSAGNIGIGYTAPAAKLSVSGTTLINTNTDNGVDKLQVSGSMNVSAKATAQNLSVTNNISVTNDINQGSGTANANYTILANGTSSGWAGRMVGDYATGGFVFQHRNNSPTFVNCWAINAGGGVGNTYIYDKGYVINGAGSAALMINTTSDNGVDELQVNGSISGIGFKQAYVTKTGAYTATNDDYVIDCTSGTFTVTLPASSGRTGRILIIKNSGAGTITVDGNASETIDGAATYSLAVQYATIQIMSDGTNWKIIAKF